MKHFKDYKKQYGESFRLWLEPKALAGIFLGVIFLVFFSVSFAETAEEVRNKIDAKSADIIKLEQEIKAYQNELDGLGKQKSSLSSSIKQLDLTRKKLIASISVTENKIERTNLKIQSLGSQIVNKEDAILNNTKAVISGLKAMNEFESANIAQTLFSKTDFTSIWNDLDAIITVNEKVKEKIVELKQVKGELEDTREETLTAKNELERLKRELADEKKIVDQNTTQKNKLLKETKNSEANYQKLVKDRLAKKEAFEKELRDYESQLQYILDPSKLPNAGVLSWPLDYIYVTQYFGKTEAGKRLYKNGSHNGIDLRAPVGTAVKAMADGIIAGTGDTDVQCPGVSFGRFVLIKYNNGLASTFGHLSLIKVNTGDKVSRGKIIGYSGNTGYSTGPHLHVSVYAKDAVDLKTLPSKSCPGKVLTQPISPINAYLDPIFYLTKL